MCDQTEILGIANKVADDNNCMICSRLFMTWLLLSSVMTSKNRLFKTQLTRNSFETTIF